MTGAAAFSHFLVNFAKILRCISESTLTTRSILGKALLVVTLVRILGSTLGFVPSAPPRILSTRQALSIDDLNNVAIQWENIATQAEVAWNSWSNNFEEIQNAESMDDVFGRLEQKLEEANLAETMSHIERGLENDISQLDTVLQTLTKLYSTLPLLSQVAIIVVSLVGMIAIYLYKLSYPPDDYRDGYEPYKRGSYDPLMAREYYSNHPKLVLQRTLQLLRIGNKFIFNVLVDKHIFRNEESQRPKRAQELLALISRAGPTAIKVGQALSVRPDLIPSEYADALSTLQDRVPPFSNSDAKLLLRQELGPIKSAKLGDLNFADGPVASASIGQVYRGQVGNREVAVKVQRPNVLAEIALDLYIVREFAPIYQRLTKSATDFQSLANEWGRVLIAELDFVEEAKNTIRFNKEMKKRNLQAVTAPTVIQDFSRQRILTTEWVHGQRLDQSNASDVPRLCSVALNAYLVMLLEMQTLHCDPHPGNLLRTDDGRLCILDFGMTLETDPTLQYSLLEFVAHLTSEAYDEVPTDLVKLGFLKEERLETVRASGFLTPLTYMLQQAGKGGGAEKVRERIFAEFRETYPRLTDEELRTQMRADMKKQIEEARKRESAVSGITMEVEELQKRNRDAFSIPEWFLYTSRAFLTLEGVSLQVDEDYSIIQSCFPYVAKRLIGDDSPRAQKALKDLLYGAGDNIDVERLTDLADGFSTYTTTTKTINQQAKRAIESETLLPTPGKSSFSSESKSKQDIQLDLIQAEAAITLAKDSADILLAPQGNLVQNLLVTESALAASAGVKDALRDSLVDTPKRIRDSLPFGSILPPLENGVVPFLKKTAEEQMAQKLLQKITTAVPESPLLVANPTALDGDPTVLSRIDSPEQAALVAKELRENLPKYAPLVGQLGGKFASTLLKTASDNIETTLSELDETKGDSDELIKAAAKGFSSIATQGADALTRRTQSR